MRKGYKLETLKVKRRGLTPGLRQIGAVAEKSKVRITIALDQDVLEYYKTRATQAGALPYQTQINQVLRHTMTSESDMLKETLISDPTFIRAVARAVKRAA